MKKKEQKEKVQRSYYSRRGLRYVSYCGAAISNGINSLLLGYLNYYLTDSVLMAVATVSAIMAVSRVFDGISDLIAGYIVDHTKTKWGKGRPYGVFTAVMWVAVVMLFCVPDLSNTGKIIYVFLVYNLTETVARTMSGAGGAIQLKFGYTDDERIELTGIAGIVSGIASMAAMIVLPILVENYGTTQEGWRMIALVFAIPGALMGLMMLFFVPEVNSDTAEMAKKKQASALESVKLFFSNKYILLYMLASFMITLAQSLGIGTYFFKYIVGDISAQSIVSLASLASMVMMPFLPMLANKFGTAKTSWVALMFTGLFTLIRYIAPENIALNAVASGIYTAMVIPMSMYGSIMMIQCMKYTEWKDGKQIDGTIAAMSNCANKVGRALGALIPGIMLGIAGYDGALAVQNEAVINVLIFLSIGFPAATSIIAALFMRKFDLEAKMPQIEKDLAERNSTNAQLTDA